MPATVEVVDFDDPIDRHVGCGDIVEYDEVPEAILGQPDATTTIAVCKSCGQVPSWDVEVW